ncbi:MAG: hypothetical protein V3V05_06310 [Pontiella sp.]
MHGKFFYSFIERDNSSFYGGIKLGVETYEEKFNGTKNADVTALVFGSLVGAEWFFSKLPELGCNFEVGYDISSYEDDVGTPKDEGDHSGCYILRNYLLLLIRNSVA